MIGANPIRDHVPGSPFQVGQRVAVVQVVDKATEDLERFVGRSGDVEYLEYECGCGQTYPNDPMIAVRFESGESVEFWPEEVREASA